MIKFFKKVFMLFSLLFAIQLSAATDWSFLPEKVAVIADQQISRQQVVQRIKQDFSEAELEKMSREKLHTAAEIVVTNKLNRIAVLALMKDCDITPNGERVIKNFRVLMATMTPKAKYLLMEKLKKNNISLADYEKKLAGNREECFRAAFTRWMEKKVFPQSTVSKEEIESFYRDNQQLFKRPESARVQCIIIPKGKTDEKRLKAENTAKEVQSMQRQGMPFELLVKKYCPDGPANISIRRKSDPKNMTPAAIEAFKLKDSQVSKLIETKRAFYLLKMIKRIPAGYLQFDKAAKIINLKLKKQKADKLVQKLVAAKRRELNSSVFL